jgi:hypothetical protein
MENEELMRCLVYYGRWMPQDFVMRSHNIDDIIYYLRAECEFEILKLTSFVTTNLINFKRIKTSRFRPYPSLRNDSMGDTFHLDDLD